MAGCENLNAEAKKLPPLVCHTNVCEMFYLRHLIDPLKLSATVLTAVKIRESLMTSFQLKMQTFDELYQLIRNPVK